MVVLAAVEMTESAWLLLVLVLPLWSIATKKKHKYVAMYVMEYNIIAATCKLTFLNETERTHNNKPSIQHTSDRPILVLYELYI